MCAIRLASVLVSLLPLLAASTPSARAAEPPFHELWRQGGELGFDGWTLAGVRGEAGHLVLDLPGSPGSGGSGTLAEGVVDGRTVWSGTALGPVLETSEVFRDLIPSWNAATPADTWLELRLRARVDGRWTRWYVLGVWSSERGHSVDGQDDADARVLTDTLALRSSADAYQVAIELFTADPDRGPAVSLVTALASRRSTAARDVSSEHRAWGTALPVPERSQMVYPGGGEVWCSPTSTSMVMAYWADRLGTPSLNHPVPEVAAGTYDPVYRGHGNWPFNTAYAARDGLVGYVSRFSSLVQVERWIEAGVPVVASLAWDPGELANAPVGSTNGHLLVIVGFSEAGDVVVNDPAGDPRRGQTVRRTYRRGQFEVLWLASSGGAVYLIHPAGHARPADGTFGAW